LTQAGGIADRPGGVALQPRRSWLQRNVWLALSLPAVAFMALAFALPLGQMLLRSVLDPDPTLAHYRELVEVPAYLRVLLNTFRIALIVTGLTLLLGYPVAYVLVRLRGWQASLMMIAVVLPLWTSELVRTFAWIVILGRKGPLNEGLRWLELIDRPIGFLFTEPAVLIGSVHIMLPFMILPLYSVMLGIDRRLVQAALSMGASPLSAFWHVTLPLSMPGVAAGCLLVFVLATGFYVTPAALGSTDQTMIAQLIETVGRRTLDWGLAAALSVTLLVSTALILVAYNRVFGLDRPTVPLR